MGVFVHLYDSFHGERERFMLVLKSTINAYCKEKIGTTRVGGLM
jgi:hypothetical protein